MITQSRTNTCLACHAEVTLEYHQSGEANTPEFVATGNVFFGLVIDADGTIRLVFLCSEPCLQKAMRKKDEHGARLLSKGSSFKLS